MRHWTGKTVLAVASLLCIEAIANGANGVSQGPHSFNFNCASLCPPNKDGTNLNLYIANPDRPVRSLFMVPQNANSLSFANHPHIEQLAKEKDMGVLYLRCGLGMVQKKCGGNNDHMQCPVSRDSATGLLAIMDTLANYSSHPEIRNVPWLTFSQSAAGHFNFYPYYIYPERMIASISNHAEVPHKPPAEEDFPGPAVHLAINGEKEWEETWRVHVRPALTGYRKTWKYVHMAVLPDVGHAQYEDWMITKREKVIAYAALYMKKAIEARLPEDWDPLSGPPTLKEPIEQNGVLLSRDVKSMLFPVTTRLDTMVQDYDKVPAATRQDFFWAFDREQAEAWLDLVSKRREIVNRPEKLVPVDAGFRFYGKSVGWSSWPIFQFEDKDYNALGIRHPSGGADAAHVPD